MGGCAAHGDTLATRDSPRQCATTRPRVDTPDQLKIAAGIQRERKFTAERNLRERLVSVEEGRVKREGSVEKRMMGGKGADQ